MRSYSKDNKQLQEYHDSLVKELRRLIRDREDKMSELRAQLDDCWFFQYTQKEILRNQIRYYDMALGTLYIVCGRVMQIKSLNKSRIKKKKKV